ncbi:Nucleolar protein, partial [Globisporangium splendens]
MARLRPQDRKPNGAGKRSHDAGGKRNGKDKKKQKVDAAAASAAPEQEDSKSLAAATLKELLGGMDLDTFFSEYFERKPLHVRSNGKHKLFPRDLFSKKKALETVQGNELSYGKDLTICKYVDGTRENYGGDGKASVSRKKVARLFDQRYSCQFYQPQRYVDELFKINAAFEAHFGCLAGASAYLTPPAAQALAPHHDDVEVFILQVLFIYNRRKKWKLYHPITELAGEHSNDLSPDQIGAPWMELTLEEGDLLYFPRGVVHQAATDDKQFSTHVTISVYQHNAWANFLEVALPRIIRRAFDSDIDFRRGLPVGYLQYMGSQFPSDSKQAQEFTETLKDLIGKLAGQVDSTDLQQAADEAAMDFVANRLPPMDESEQDMSISPLDGKVSIRFKDRSHIRLAMGEDEMKEAFIAVYYSSKNCRIHHMGLCTCHGNFHDEDGASDDGSDDKGEGDDDEDEGKSEDGEHDGSDGDGGDDDEGDFAATMGQVPAQPQSIAFPGELAQPLMKLYSSYPKFIPVDSLDSDESDETAVRGMLLRLWSEGLLEVSKQ